MRGRSITYQFLPFSFPEFLISRDIQVSALTRDEESLVRNLLMEYLEFGGFPDVVTSETKVRILEEYFDSILFKDVVERHNVKNLHLVNLIFRQMVCNFSKEFSVNAMYNTFKSQGAWVSRDTIYKYLNYFEDSASVFFLKRHSEKIRMKESWPRKVYLSDTGMSKILKASEDTGRPMENCVFLKLLRLKNDNPLLAIDYYKDIRGMEVDFVPKEGRKADELIQVTYSSGFDEIRENETRNLLKAGKELKCKKLAVITWDYEDERKLDGDTVHFVPLWKWLLFPPGT